MPSPIEDIRGRFDSLWELRNREPFIGGPWSLEEALKRIAWLDRRWEAFKEQTT